MFTIHEHDFNQNTGPSGPPLDPFEGLKQAKSVYAEHRKLKIYSIAAGTGVISFLAARFLYGYALNGIQPLRELIINNNNFYLSLTALFYIVSVGVPFFIALHFMKKISVGELLPAGKPHNTTDMVLLIVAGFGACIAAGIISSYFSAYVQGIFGVKFEYTADPVPKTAVGLGLHLLSYAVMPALMEEFALRGVTMQPLRKYGDWFAILMSALVFALMHGNMVQVPFAFIAGIALGFAVIKSGTLWTGIIIHFLNNASSVLQSIYMESSAESGTQWLVIYFYYGFALLLGGICAFFYFRRLQKRERARYSQENPFAFPLKRVPVLYKDSRFQLRGCVGEYVSTVPMIAAIVIMVFQTIATISFGG